MAFLIRLVLFIVRTSSVCLVLNFHPKRDAETKLQRRTQSPKVSVSVASRYREMLREWTTQAGEIGTKRLKTKRTERRTTQKATSSDCQSLHPFSSDEK